MKFGDKIVDARNRIGWSQKELAARIKKKNGESISFQYLSDIERCKIDHPPMYLVDQLAEVLKIEREVLYYMADEFLPNMKGLTMEDEKIIKAYKAFMQELI